MAHEVGWEALLAHPEVTETLRLGSPFGFMAFHGGLEAGTLEIAGEAARRAGASLYAVDQPAELRWHVASALVDPAASPALAGFLGHVTRVVALHGYGRPRPPDPVLVGGADRRLAAEVAGVLRSALDGTEVVDDLDAIPARLRGVHPANPVNRVRGGGVQVELPVAVRRHAAEQVVAALSAVATRHTPPGGRQATTATAGIRPPDPRSG